MTQAQTTADDFSNVPTVHRVKSLALELLHSNSDPLRERIASAGENADQVRLELQRQAERRKAEVRGSGPAAVRLFAWPMMVGSEAPLQMLGEPFIMTPKSPLFTRLAGLWAESFAGSGAKVVYPLQYAVHLNEVLGVAPNRVHECVFRFASQLEGYKKEAYRFTTQPRKHPVCGPLAGAYLMLAYVVSPPDVDDPLPYASAQLLSRSSELMRASIQESETPPIFRLLQPRGFYAAIEVAQREQLAHFAEWCERHGAQWDLNIEDTSDNDAKAMTVTARYALPGSNTTTHEFSYDGMWRTDAARMQLQQAVQSRARAMKSQLRAGGPQARRAVSIH